MKQLLFVVVVFFLSLTATTTIWAQSNNTRAKHYHLDGQLAIKGYDPVAYFTQHKAVQGKATWSASVEGVTYYFSSAANKAIFQKNPMQYEPQYGGWCAYAMGYNGKKVDVDPETFKILNGKLYLFYNAYFNNTLKSWNKDEANLQEKANANWAKIIQ